MNQIILALILSFLPISELRGGLPVAINYALNNNISIMPIFFIVVLTNIAAVFFVFFFLDFLHKRLMGITAYKRTFNFFLERTRKKADKLKKDMAIYGFFALMIFVAIPLPATGAWTGCLIAWVLGLDRKASIISISAGVLIAGIIMLIGTFGFINLLRLF
jgi:uncharacterized membrane protein